MIYYRAIPLIDHARRSDAAPLAGGRVYFNSVERITRGTKPQIIPLQDVPADVLSIITAPRPDLCGLRLDQPRIMGILNVTPDSFSDGGRFINPQDALSRGMAMIAQGADIIDIGGESTRPGAQTVPADEELNRIAPAIQALRGKAVLSIDTRKSDVAAQAVALGADMLNDVSAMHYDPNMAQIAAQSDRPICLMHAQGTPENMQNNPYYDDVVLDVYDALAERITAARAAGIKAEHIIIDPGIGFGKTTAHNLALLRNLSLFHSLGYPILLGASRKRFISEISGAQDIAQRLPGSLSVALFGVAQGVQILRVHDTLETQMAVLMQRALVNDA